MISLRRPRLRVPLSIASITAGVSALAGVLWAFLAPPEHLLVVSDGRGIALTGQSLHQFDSSAIFVWQALIIGVVSAVATWTVRSARGPVGFAGLLIGSVVGSGLMTLTGLAMATLLYPVVDNPAVNDVVARPPGIGTLLVLIFQPLAASIVILVLAVLSPDDDLGSGRHCGSDPESAERESAARRGAEQASSRPLGETEH
ncbi:DUF2567 domain-containing protein [Rhodococcus sp. 27YEA15]|uniref:DUF2567 domain-containing protein n=1 Tax=Rhodococcus sp. 27YEA15 TaxID=3156259 RepID=UPI003C7C1DFA